MRQRLFLLVVVCSACFLTAAAQSVDEAASSLTVNGRTASVALVVDHAGAGANARISLELVDPAGRVRASAAPNLKLKRGRATYRVELPLGEPPADQTAALAWHRLRYRVGASEGFISLTELLKDAFELRVAASETFRPGMDYSVRVRAVQPHTEAPVRKVRLEAALVLDIDTDADEDELELKGRAETDENGFAVLRFRVPAGVKFDGDGDLRVTGRKNGVVRELDEDLDEPEEAGSMLLMTDKPLYQPGQTFNVRGIYFDRNATIVPDAELEFAVRDGDDTVLYKETVKTSAYGIAAVSWKIPESAKLGDYRVEIETADGDELGSQKFKVSRYDLPNFTVTAVPDKPYYLPGDTRAEITVRADYLFGQPVTRGRVRVVEENDRRWNWEKQKYDVDEGAAVEGATDADGKFVAKIDLAEKLESLRRSGWKRFEDLNFAAYFTDPTTNRTEQRRFDVRLSKEAIHVYLINGRSDLHAGLPATAYVSTFYADGTPAVCDVEVKNGDRRLAGLKSNALGAAKLELAVPDDWPGSYFELQLTARDREGRTGSFNENRYLHRRDALRVTTEKTIHKPGEPIRVELLSTRREGVVYLDVIRNWAVVDSYFVRLKEGRAELRIPYQPQFKGELTLSAYDDERAGSYYYYDDRMRAARGIVYPARQNLQLDAQFSAATYKPNEEAKVRFSVLDEAGRGLESALGVVVFDKAIEERARTDADFGGYFSRFGRWLGYDKSFGRLTLKDINELDLSKPIAPEWQLAAEVMLASNHAYPSIFHTKFDRLEAKSLYADAFAVQLAPVEAALKKQYARDYAHPIDDASLRRILAAQGIDFDALRDPWGNAYKASFTVSQAQNLVTLTTAGTDEKFGTGDDFSVSTSAFHYFSPLGDKINKAVTAYAERTGDFIRDRATLAAELARQDVDLDRIKDRWNRDYRISFETIGRNYVIRVLSVGANGYYEPTYYNRDDFDVWTSSIDYFAPTEKRIKAILKRVVDDDKKPFPNSTEEFRRLLVENGFDLDALKDGYGMPFYLEQSLVRRAADKKTAINGAEAITPVTEEITFFTVKSRGPSLADQRDDFVLGSFSGVSTRYTVEEGPAIRSVSYTSSLGAIRGTVTDPNGAAVAGATVKATNEADAAQVFTKTTDENGVFLIENLPAGLYSVRVDAANFKSLAFQNVQVAAFNLVELKATLEIGTVSAVVEVTSEAADVSVQASVIGQRQLESLPLNARNTLALVQLQPGVLAKKDELATAEENSTPRLREYFPETLFWQPEVLTDKSGRAELKFKMADNITTWKLYTVASTKQGKIGVVEKEVTAFQPFFADLDPPKFLTEGDEISLPVTVRNYTERKQKVDVTMAEADWFRFFGPARQQLDVASNDSGNAIFGFQATRAVAGGKQRVTALAAKDSDAVEKPVTVRPNGQEIVRTDSKYFTVAQTFAADFPASALAGTPRAELKIYPNLFAHVAESVEGLLQRPYGCGEQTTSSTYPNLMILKFTKGEPRLREKAERFLHKGYDRLLGYQVGDGGFSYWGGKDRPDVALTAYVLRFLADAEDHLAVDEDVYERAEKWLIAQQQPDGSFLKYHYWETAADASRTNVFTAYVARTLAMRKDSDKQALAKALGYLKSRLAAVNDPYTIALYGLAAFDAGQKDEARAAARRLASMAVVADEGGVYWQLAGSTPFYGWGDAGNIEATALALQLLIKAGSGQADDKELIGKATLHLLKKKDRFGVWYSTQTTINVLDAFLASLGGTPAAAKGESQALQVYLNGALVENVTVAADRIEPVFLNLSEKLAPAANRVEIKAAPGAALMAQLVATHYIDWKDSPPAGGKEGAHRLMRLDYRCDRQKAEIMQEISCSVAAEKLGANSYGMMLAEIGLPPGADVSRESLQAAMEADWSLSRYDVLPDRLVVYMWARPNGGTRFDFKFKPRYGINAQTPASFVYDYYNEEARATVAPLKFEVK